MKTQHPWSAAGTQACRVRRGPWIADAGATVPSRFARELLAQLFLDSATQAALLERCDLSLQVLESDARIAPAQYRTLVRQACWVGSDEAYGYFARPVPPGSFERLLRLLVHQPDVGSDLHEAAGFYALFSDAEPWSVESCGSVARLRLNLAEPRQAESAMWVLMLLLALWHTAGWLSCQTISVLRVVLPQALVEHASQARFLFGTKADFAEAALLELPLASLSTPLGRAPEQVQPFARQLPSALLAPGLPCGLEARLRSLLACAEPYAGLTASQAAEALGLSRQTLNRRLAEMGTRFSAIRDELRRDMACTLLTRGRPAIAEIAELLDYSEPSAFHRAFKQWTGMAPGAYRECKPRSGMECGDRGEPSARTPVSLNRRRAPLDDAVENTDIAIAAAVV